MVNNDALASSVSASFHSTIEGSQEANMAICEAFLRLFAEL